MYPYWLLFGLFAIGALFCVADYRFEKPLGFLWIGAIVLTLFIGLRFWTGVDWSTYLRTWDAAGGISLPALIQRFGGDPAFYTLLWLLRQSGLEYWSLNLVCAAVFTAGLVCFARRLSLARSLHRSSVPRDSDELRAALVPSRHVEHIPNVVSCARWSN